MLNIFLLNALMCLSISAFACMPVGVIGDSISVPIPIMASEAYHAILAKEYNWRVINYSYGGAKTDDLMKRLKHMVENDKPQLVIICLGVNDAIAGTSFEVIYNRLVEAIVFLKENRIPLLIGSVDVSSVNWQGPLYTKNFHLIYDWIREKYPEVRVFPFMVSEYFTDTSYHCHSQDRLHPNVKGHREIAQAIKNALN